MITDWKIVEEKDVSFYRLEIFGVTMMHSTKKGNAMFLKKFKPVIQKQMHSHTIVNIDEVEPETGDGMISGCRDIYLGIKVADCLPVFMWSKAKICVLHCGWRGIAGGIVDKAKQIMSDYHYAFGASIGSCCYEIRNDVEKIFLKRNPVSIQKRNDKIFLDLKAAVINALGRDKLIADLNICTKCRNDIFYSYRAGDTDQRNYAIIGKK